MDFVDGIEDEDDDLLDELITIGDDEIIEDDLIVRTATIAPVDINSIGKALDSLPTQSSLARALITQIQELHQLLGDADAHFALVAADIEAGLRLHFLEFQRNPGSVLLGVLASMDDEVQLRQITKIRKLLDQRESRINATLGGEANDE